MPENKYLDRQGVGQLATDTKGYVDTQVNTKQDKLTAGTNIIIDTNNVIKVDIESFTTAEMEEICDDILYPALPAPENVSASGTDISFDEVQGAESYVVYANGNEIGEVSASQEEYFLTFSSPSSFTLNVSTNTQHWDGTLEYSIDKTNWNEWDGTTALNSGSNNELYLRGIGNTIVNDYGKSWQLNGADISCTGNIENLLDYQTVANGQHPTMANHCYDNMFRGCTSLTSAPELPATTLTEYCYSGMFRDCKNLTSAPELPATTLAGSCYSLMFVGCTSLTSAPALPATTLADTCYNQMFKGCTSLTTAPALPATTFAKRCYSSMFQNCTSLTSVPELPATTLADGCYSNMFRGCTLLYVSDTQTPEAQYEWRIPTNGVIDGTTYLQTAMFRDCLGTRASNHLAGEVGQQYIYYTQNPPVGSN